MEEDLRWRPMHRERLRNHWYSAGTCSRPRRWRLFKKDGLAVAAMLDAWVGEPDDGVLRGFWHKTDMYQAWHDGEDVPGRTPHLPGDITRAASNFLFGKPSLTGSLFEQLRPYAELEPSRPLTLIVRLHYPGVSAASVGSAIRRFGSEVLPHLKQARFRG